MGWYDPSYTRRHNCLTAVQIIAESKRAEAGYLILLPRKAPTVMVTSETLNHKQIYRCLRHTM